MTRTITRDTVTVRFKDGKGEHSDVATLSNGEMLLLRNRKIAMPMLVPLYCKECDGWHFHSPDGLMFNKDAQAVTGEAKSGSAQQGKQRASTSVRRL